MSARRIAREIAVIVMPQLPKDKGKLDGQHLDDLVEKTVRLLCDYARNSLSEANALLLKASQEITDTELDHPENRRQVHDIKPVQVTTGQLKSQLHLLEQALNFVAEALDVPEMALVSTAQDAHCPQCGHEERRSTKSLRGEVKDFLVKLVSAYVEHKTEIDDYIKEARAKWQVERMVSIDRDILRLACAEALYLPEVPVNVAISEAVELSHRFADERAAKFINGVLADLSERAEEFRKVRALEKLATGGDEAITFKSKSS